MSYNSILRKKDILNLDIPMEDFGGVDVLNSNAELSKPIQNLKKDIRGSLNTKLFLL
jgi:hypothetical protein